MSDQPSDPATPLAYEPTTPTDAYKPIKVDGATVVFPSTCCSCLKPTASRYTIRGHRIRSRSLTGAIVAGALDVSDFFELKVPVCSRCWREYLARQRSRWFLAPGLGAIVGASLVIPMWFLQRRDGDNDTLAIWITAVFTTFIGLLIGVWQAVRVADWCAKPPAKLGRRFLGGVTIRFKNPAYVEPFLKAQIEEPQRQAEADRQQRAALAESIKPASDRDDACYYLVNGQSTGPVPWQSIRDMLATGELTADSKLWSEGWKEWCAAKDVYNLLPPA